MNYSIIGGLDVGNGYTKGIFGDINGNIASKVDIPSSVAYVTMANDIKSTGEDIKCIIDDIYNKADISFDSSAIRDNNRRYFGSRAIHSGYVLEEFNVYQGESKAKQELSPIIVIGTIASCALRNYYNEYGDLPNDMINVRANIGIALPIREYKKYREYYAKLYIGEKHYATFHNFEKLVRVCVEFDDVQVLAEGASAQFAINDKGEAFVDALLTECRKHINIDASVQAADVINSTTTVGVDIGEGTINFPVYQNGRFNTDISFTINKGYGTVLSKTIDRLQDEGFPFEKRKELTEYLNRQPTNITKRKYNKVLQILNEEIQSFIIDVGLEFSKLLSKVGTYVEVVYVYGGGASPLRDALYPKLCELFNEYQIDVPILYLDSTYSRFLNREGLYLIEKNIVQSKK